MSDRFHPLTMEQLTGWVFDELETQQSIFGIPSDLFFTPSVGDRFRLSVYSRLVATSFNTVATPLPRHLPFDAAV